MKVSELTGEALRLAVARAAGYRLEQDGGEWVVYLPNGEPRSLSKWGWKPDEDWSHGGPIIERERIMLVRFDDRTDWTAWVGGWLDIAGDFGETKGNADGPTALIAAMRAYVASKLGEEVPDA